MKNNLGQIISINKKENVAVIMEEGTEQELLIFLDDLEEQVVQEIQTRASFDFPEEWEKLIVDDLVIMRPSTRKVA